MLRRKLPLRTASAPKLPIKIPIEEKSTEKPDPDEVRASQDWVDGIKAMARENVNDGGEYLRIAWQNRFNRPRYEHFDKYLPEEMILELWEQYYFEHPDDVSLKGVVKKTNAETGYAYYETGDPFIDELERQFGEGGCPDLNAAFEGKIHGKAPSIFRAPVFYDEEMQPYVPFPSHKVTTTQKGDKIDQATGDKVEVTDFKNENWNAEDDPILAAFAKKLGVKDG